MRINELARTLGEENRSILDYLETIGVTNKSHSSSIDNETADLVLAHFRGEGDDEEDKDQDSKRGRFARVRRPKGWKPPKEDSHDEYADDDLDEDESLSVRRVVKQTGVVEEEEKTAAGKETSVQQVIDQGSQAAQKQEAAAAHKKDKHAKKKQHAAKKHKTTLTLGAEAVVEPGIFIEAPNISDDSADAAEPVVKVDREMLEDPDKAVLKKRDQDDPIRREIQKLKQKQKRVGDKEETKEKQPVARRRHRDAQPKGKTKKAWKREKRIRLERQIAEEEQRIERDKTVVKVHDATTVADVANSLGIDVNELIGKLIGMGVMASINQPLDYETIQIIADDYNFQVERVDLFDSDLFAQLWEEQTDESRVVKRAPVVTVMGHVDHGKTKLLDAVRSTDVVSQEAGGITQHIGAYYVKTSHGEIVFLDTPGHQAFTAMRARGAMVTDIVVLVVAATDGIMPQTVEAIHHAKAADVPIIVAMNKIDAEGANLDRLKQQLAENNLLTEDWGGKTIAVPISALKKIGIDELLENISLQAELLELKADPECRARGTIIEGRLEQGRGPVATVLIQQGVLKIGDPFVTGIFSGRVRAMINDKGERILEAGPSTPVEIIGIDDVPSAGDPFVCVEDDSQAKQISARLQQIQRERELKRIEHVTLEALHTQIETGKVKELRIIVKGDVQGSVGALCESLMKIESEKVRINILHSGVGAISESDVMLASASNALIIGFNVRPNPHVSDLAKREHVEIRTYRIIYDAIEEIRKAMTGMLDRVFEERFIGRAEIREVFRVSKGLSIAGSYITDGKIVRNSPVRLLRDSIVVHEGKLSSLRRFKEDVREVQTGYECGLGFERFSDLRVGDTVECFEMVEVAATL